MKWETIHPKKGKYDFAEADKLMEFAKKHKMKVRGHTLVWHYQLPNWLLSEKWTKEEMMHHLEDHIKTIVGRYKGRI